MREMTMSAKNYKNWRSPSWIALGLVLAAPSALAQEPATILEIQLQNGVSYWDDLPDPSKLATSPDVARPASTRTFMRWLTINDIVSVNGKPAKGAEVHRGTVISLTPNPSPGQAIADAIRANIHDFCFEIQQADGTPIGAIMATGLSGGVPPPGAPRLAAIGNNAIVGGTGAFLGARGQVESANSSARQASMIEDPASRRVNGGGPTLFIVHLIPLRRPEIATSSTGPAVFHADFSPITSAKPAKAGEVLIVRATGLGPTVPGVDPGQSFPIDALQQVNSPVDVTVNGQSAEVMNKIGWPGQVDTYRLDFRVPDGATAGMAAIQLTAAWIAGSPVNIPIQ
jgi:uncharacterized protein (TIGR03437 family)